MAGVELHNINIKFMQLWNAGYEARLTVECRAGKATINLRLTLGESPPPPPACQVRPQPRGPGPSCLRRVLRPIQLLQTPLIPHLLPLCLGRIDPTRHLGSIPHPLAIGNAGEFYRNNRKYPKKDK